ncbi:hypothetical protein RKD30_005985 [Streptomyces pristinaespiralis]
MAAARSGPGAGRGTEVPAAEGRVADAVSREASRPRARPSSPSGAAGRGQTNARRPPGRRDRPMFVNAAVWSAKNITPPRLIATSWPPAGNGCTWASPHS